MALSEDQIIDLFNEACRETFNGLERFRYFAHAVESEVRKSDEALIRQLVDALGVATTPLVKDRQEVLRAISAGRARLEGKL
jgi:hypothetical protein